MKDQRFTYETRTSSSDFITKLTSLELTNNEFSKQEPSKYIKSLLWFTNAYKVDSTVQSMLIMLDSIHAKYEDVIHQADNKKLFDNLDYLKFYVLLLEDFGLSEELYIKMNARGLPLTPFENFKADFVGYYKNKSDDWLDFATNLDTKWIDFFWNKDDKSDKHVNDRFFRFFYRYCAIIVFLEYKGEEVAKSFSNNIIFKFFQSDSEEQSNDKARYQGFKYYKELLDNGINLKEKVSKILDVFSEYKDVLDEQLTSQWGDKCAFFENEYTQRNAIVFATFVQFILNYDKFDESNFKRWMRIVWNVVENTNIDGIVPQINTTRSLNEILVKDKETKNIYQTIALLSKKTSPQAIFEEAIKAKLINKDPKFEELFMGLEKHPFFKGFIDVIIPDEIPDESAKIRDLYKKIETRKNKIQGCFDEKGIFLYKQEHILIRAMVSSIRKWNDGLKGLRIRETVNSDAHLKQLLRKPEIKKCCKMF